MAPEESLILPQALLQSPLQAQAKNEDAESVVDQDFTVFDKEIE
jgi:hypothetical protein